MEIYAPYVPGVNISELTLDPIDIPAFYGV